LTIHAEIQFLLVDTLRLSGLFGKDKALTTVRFA
jgi:hypothetical protein